MAKTNAQRQKEYRERKKEELSQSKKVLSQVRRVVADKKDRRSAMVRAVLQRLERCPRSN